MGRVFIIKLEVLDEPCISVEKVEFWKEKPVVSLAIADVGLELGRENPTRPGFSLVIEVDELLEKRVSGSIELGGLVEEVGGLTAVSLASEVGGLVEGVIGGKENSDSLFELGGLNIPGKVNGWEAGVSLIVKV